MNHTQGNSTRVSLANMAGIAVRELRRRGGCCASSDQIEKAHEHHATNGADAEAEEHLVIALDVHPSAKSQ